MKLTELLDVVSISDLTRIRDGANTESILTHLTATTFVTYDYGDCLRLSYTIPSLISSLIQSVTDDRVS